MGDKSGKAMAAELLAHLGKAERDRILAHIEKEQPETASELRKLLVTIDDLPFITVKMLQALLGKISTDDLGLALRLAQAETRRFVLNQVSTTLRRDLEEVFAGPPMAATKVQEACERVMSVMRKMVDREEIIIKRDGDEYI